VLLEDHAGSVTQWRPHQWTGYPSTNFGEPGKFSAAAYSMHLGEYSPPFPTQSDTKFPRSVFSSGWTSYLIQDALSLGSQQFIVASPSYLQYVLPACPNYLPATEEGGSGEVGDASTCPRRDLQVGEYKFTTLALLSGTDVNSLRTAGNEPPKGDTASRESDFAHKDIAKYKTLIYRTVIDTGAMGDSQSAWVEFADGAQTPLTELDPDTDVVDAKLHIKGSKHSGLVMSFVKHYTTGTFTRNMAERVCDSFGTPNGNTAGGVSYTRCSVDVTGFSASPDSVKPGTWEDPEEMKKAGTAEMAAADVAGLAAAPKLVPTDVSPMKITLKAASCTGRPASPPWDAPPADCPWWYTYSHAQHETGELVFVVTDLKDNVMKCESGACYHLDYHIDLGGADLASRTVFGNPGNDAALGLETGTFFIYDPTVSAEDSRPPLRYSLRIAFVASGTVSDYSDADKTNILSALSSAAGFGSTPAGSSCDITAASVNIVATLRVTTQSAADAAKSAFNAAVPDAATLTTLLANNGVAGVTVEALTTVGTTASGGGNDIDAAVIIGAAAGGAVALLALVLVVWYFKCRKKAGKKATV